MARFDRANYRMLIIDYPQIVIEKSHQSEESNRGFQCTYIRRDMNATDVSRLHEEHFKLERILARIRKHAVSHYDIHVPVKKKKKKKTIYLSCRSFILKEENIVEQFLTYVIYKTL